MSDREAHRFDHLSDGHLADKAAYGDSGAFVVLADRFGDRVWSVAALAAADEGTATRATARAFTRTLAGVAAGIGDPDTCVEHALVAAAFELAVTARVDRVDRADLVAALPPALRDVDPATRVALWLTTAQGWSEADAVAAVTGVTDGPAPDLATVPPAARQAAGDLDLHPPSGSATATADAWHEWQGIGLTIPERHPLTAVLARLDVPLGRVGDALGRAGSHAPRRRRRTRAATPAATPPPAVLLPIGAEPTAERTPAAPAPAEAEIFLGPRTEGLDLPDRRGRRDRPRHLVTAGSTPTRTRVLAALAAGILTAGAVGSLLTTTPTDAPGVRADEVAAGAPADQRGEGALLDDIDLVPAANVTDADAEAPTTGAPVVGTTAGAPTGTGGTTRDAARPPAGTGGTGTSGAPAPSTPAAGAPGAGGSGGSAGGGAGTGGGGSAPAPAPQPAPPVTQAPAPPPATAPPTTTPPPPPTTTPPTTTTTPPGPVCTLLPVLCPGGGLVP